MASRSADQPLRVLHLEDSELDHELMLAHLRRGGLVVEPRRVDNEADFLRALDDRWDAIISDYNLPGFSGLVALDLLMARGGDVPFILVSGEIGEDTLNVLLKYEADIEATMPQVSTFIAKASRQNVFG